MKSRYRTHEDYLEGEGRIDKETGELKPPTADAPNVFTKSLVQTPTKRQLRVFSDIRAKVCQTCTAFNHNAGQNYLFKKKGLATILHEYKWRTENLCAAPEDMAICDQHGCLTGPTHAACEFYKLDTRRH